MIATSQHHSKHSAIRLLAMLALAFFAVQAGFLSTQAVDDRTGKSALFLLIIIQFVPFTLGVMSSHIGFLAFVFLNHCFTFSIAKYNSYFNVLGLEALPIDARMGVHELINATLLITMGYYFIDIPIWSSIAKEKRANMISISLRNKQLWIIGGVVITSSMVGKFLPAAIKQIHDLAYVMCLILLLSSTALQSKALHRLILLGAVANMSHTLVELGSLVDFGHFAVILFVRSAVTRNYRGILGVCCIVLVGLFIQPIKNLYRTQSRAGDFSVVDKFGILTDLVKWRYFTEEGWAYQKLRPNGMPIDPDSEEAEAYLASSEEGGALSALSMGFTRVHDDSFERTLMMTPSRVPFWEGETYANLLYMFIPRILWPDKPSWKHWHKFGKSYGYLAPNDSMTSVSFSMFAEAYMNFGFPGLYIVSLFFGFLLGIAERVAFSVFSGNYIFSYVSLLTPLMNYSADLGIMINRLVIVVTALMIFRPMLTRNIIGDDYSQ